jgi:hypothetical protein
MIPYWAWGMGHWALGIYNLSPFPYPSCSPAPLPLKSMVKQNREQSTVIHQPSQLSDHISVDLNIAGINVSKMGTQLWICLRQGVKGN